MSKRPDWYRRLEAQPFKKNKLTHEKIRLIELKLTNKSSTFGRFAPLMGITVAGVLLVGIFALNLDKTWSFISNWNSVQRSSLTQSTPQNQEQLPEVGQNEAVNYPPRNKVFENQDQLPVDEKVKAEFIQKMAYSYQNINTLSGKALTNINSVSSTVEFDIREGKNPASYEVVTQPDGTINEYINDNHYMLEQTNGKEDRVTKVGPRNPEMEPRTSFVSTASDGNPSYYLPVDPAWSRNGQDIVSPLRNLGFMVVDLNLWSFKGEDILLGRKAKLIEGKLPSYQRQKGSSVSYKIWVDDETGMLFKKQFYDKNGNIVETFEVTSIEINPILDNSIFEIPDEKLKEIDQTGKHMMTTSPHMMTGDFPVPDSINEKWEEAKSNRQQTTTIPFNDDWYIIPKEGYLVNYIKVNGHTGTIVMSPTTKGLVPAVAKNYKLNEMKIEYEK
ncbi:hypothetical protein QFZ77_007579 [Paenibacillus sp. V4I3]|uniref:sigma-E factor regulatory protein RseB domain-containing protein n=1 Tax=Paenibacillus sp. V4I3 TaxID=3042305 RepID=UPI0027852504|nr:sigma-E factor regulatory protein RseB domain-containing protein [Paenibacillus sp. V4I3]MDQ0878920.1 hypothetical protein [Paenibacillus sp. V4I3]